VADAALAARDLAAADRALAALLADDPRSPLADQAHYDRARIAYQRRAWAAARQHLAQLAALPTSLLAEPGHWLRCRVEIEARDSSRGANANANANTRARTCLVDYRRAYPRSPHDLDALSLLARVAYASGGCAAAATLVDELAQTYPRTTLAASWRNRCPANAAVPSSSKAAAGTPRGEAGPPRGGR
jgi:hypothetical protein